MRSQDLARSISTNCLSPYALFPASEVVALRRIVSAYLAGCRLASLAAVVAVDLVDFGSIILKTFYSTASPSTTAANT
eukprot:9135-Heterococcus_DN1.PRE.5